MCAGHCDVCVQLGISSRLERTVREFMVVVTAEKAIGCPESSMLMNRVRVPQGLTKPKSSREQFQGRF